MLSYAYIHNWDTNASPSHSTCLPSTRGPAQQWLSWSTTSSWLPSAGCCVRDSWCTSCWWGYLEHTRRSGWSCTPWLAGVSVKQRLICLNTLESLDHFSWDRTIINQSHNWKFRIYVCDLFISWIRQHSLWAVYKLIQCKHLPKPNAYSIYIEYNYSINIYIYIYSSDTNSSSRPAKFDHTVHNCLLISPPLRNV